MKRSTRLLAIIMALTICLTFALSACGGGGEEDPLLTQGATKMDPSKNKPATGIEASGATVINLWTFNNEVVEMSDDFVAKYNPGYTFNSTVTNDQDGAYQTALEVALAAGGADAPDIFTAESAFMKRFAQSEWSLPICELGIDVESEAAASEIAQYTLDLASTADGVVKGLGYQSTGGVFIYRRSVADEYLGGADPANVYSKVKDWDTFIQTAKDLKAASNGEVVMVSGLGDVWHAMENSRQGPWIQNKTLTIDDNINKFFELSKVFKDEGLMNDTQDWSDPWYADMRDEGAKKVFGWFGPAWFPRYVIQSNTGAELGDDGLPVEGGAQGTFGDWAVCQSPAPFFWGGTWLMAYKDTQKKKEVADFIRYVAFDLDGAQAKWVQLGDTVCSGKIMSTADGSATVTGALCGGQNIFDVFRPANASVDVKTLGPLDDIINRAFREQVNAYVAGEKDQETAIADFKAYCADNILGLKT